MNESQHRDLTLGTAHLVYNAIGRTEDIEKLHAQLCQTTRPLVVTGVGGLGKTTFAQLYWQQHRDKYACAAWLSTAALYTADETRRTDNAEYFLRAFLDHPQLKTNLQVNFDPLQRPVEQFRQIIAALADMGAGPHLLVIDNAPEAAAAYLPELASLPHWRILLTSREAIQNMAKFELDALPPDLAAELFERIYEAPARSEALDTLLDDIGYHTLTIELLAAYAREKRLDPAGLLALLREKGLMQLDDYEVSVPRYHQNRDIAAHLRDLFLLELSSEESDILRSCCILPTSNVPLEPLAAEVLTEEGLCNLLGKQETEKAFKKCLRRLAKLHWLVEKNGGYRCHPVIAETAKAQLLPDSVNCGVLIENVTELLKPNEENNEPQISRSPFGPLGEAVFKGVWKEEGDFGEEDVSIGWLANWLGILFHSLGEYYKFLGYCHHTVNIREKALHPEHSDLATSYHNLASAYEELGDYQKSLKFNQKALDIREAAFPLKNSDLAQSYNNIAETYRVLGEHQKSLDFNHKALAIWEKNFSSEHRDVAITYNNLALTFGALGQHQNALEFIQKAILIFEKVLPKEHPSLARSYNNLALTYYALGNTQLCVEYFEKSLSIFGKVLPSEHPDLALSYNNLAGALGALGEHQKDLEYSLKALAIREKVLPLEHPSLAESYNNIALTYHALGDLRQAVDYMRRAAVIWEKSLPAAHPYVAMAKKNLATLEEQLGR